MLLIHGNNDEVVPVSQSRAMAAKLESLGLEPVLLEIEGGPHFEMNGSQPFPEQAFPEEFDPEGADATKRFVKEGEMLGFLRKHLRIDELAGEDPAERARRRQAELLAEEKARQDEIQQKAASLMMSGKGKPKIRLDRMMKKADASAEVKKPRAPLPPSAMK